MEKRVALYGRVSSSKQVKERTIESQIEELREFSSENNFCIEKDFIFTDNGVSGATLVRPALDKLRDKAVSGEIEFILVLCPDRLARKYAHQLILIEEFERLGVEIVFANKNISANPEDQLLLQIQGVISEYEREKIIERSRRGKLQKAKRGVISVLSGAPYGYVYVPKAERIEAVYEIHHGEAEVVKKIFKMYCYEKLSIAAIVRKLEKDGVPSRNNRLTWSRSTIWGILKNPAYSGRAAFRKTKRVERKRLNKRSIESGRYPDRVKSSIAQRDRSEWINISVPAIIDGRTFEIAGMQLSENKKLSSRNNKKHDYLLGGLLRCSSCGYALRGYSRPNSTRRLVYSYYRCGGDSSHSLGGRICTSLKSKILDDLVWKQVVELLETPEVVINEYINRINSQRDIHSSLSSLIKRKDQGIRQVEHEKERLLDLYQSGVLRLEEIENRLKKLRLRIKSIEGEKKLLEMEQKEQNRHLQLVEQLSDFKERVGKNLNELDFCHKKEIVRLLVQEVMVDANTNEIKVRHVIPRDKKVPLCTRSQ